MNWPLMLSVLINLACAVYVWLTLWNQKKLEKQLPELPENCLCEFVIISAQPLVYLPAEALMVHPAQTVVLIRCTKCGSHNVETYMGHWSTAELLRERSEIADLEKLLK